MSQKRTHEHGFGEAFMPEAPAIGGSGVGDEERRLVHRLHLREKTSPSGLPGAPFTAFGRRRAGTPIKMTTNFLIV
jgi:hypothetical protein